MIGFSNPELDRYDNQLDAEYADLAGTRPEHECLDLVCGHYDGDRCALGGTYDCPPAVKCPACGTVTRKVCDCDQPCECEYICEECCAHWDLVNGYNPHDYCDNCGKYTFRPVNASYDRCCSECGYCEENYD